MGVSSIIGKPHTAAARSAAVPRSSVAFDWTMGILSGLLVGGIVLDGWAHAHGQVDESFLTPWHALLYSMMALNGIVLGTAAVRNLRRGAPVRNPLPYGYSLALAGVVLFTVGGVGDLLWHTAFGIETGLDALLSPSHLVLALAAMLIFSGPLRSLGRQYDSEAGGWRRIGPAVPALLACATLLGFFLGYAQPIEDGESSLAIQRDPAGPPLASLWAADSDGTRRTALETPPNLDIWGLTSSPDGSRIAYRAQAPSSTQSNALLASNLFVARPDGSQARQITRWRDHATQPAWSPDGAWLAYVLMPAGTSGNFTLHIVRADGSGDRVLVDGVTTLGDPAWSGDAKTIVYESRSGFDAELAAVDVASGTSHWLAYTKGGSNPAWNRDRLAFVDGEGALVSVGLVTIHAGGGTSWTPDMLLGTPLLCACAGLLVGFCFQSPIPEARAPATRAQ